MQELPQILLPYAPPEAEQQFREAMETMDGTLDILEASKSADPSAAGVEAQAFKERLDRLSQAADPQTIPQEFSHLAHLRQFVELNNAVLDRFTAEERAKIGVHTCPGGDQDSVHSLDVDYAGLLPALFDLKAGRFFVQLASEADPERALRVIADHLKADQRVFVGVTDPIDPRVETAEEVRDRVLTAAKYLPAERLGTCDDCGFSPFADDTSTSRDIAFAKIAARVEGTRLAAEKLG